MLFRDRAWHKHSLIISQSHTFLCGANYPKILEVVSYKTHACKRKIPKESSVINIVGFEVILCLSKSLTASKTNTKFGECEDHSYQLLKFQTMIMHDSWLENLIQDESNTQETINTYTNYWMWWLNTQSWWGEYYAFQQLLNMRIWSCLCKEQVIDIKTKLHNRISDYRAWNSNENLLNQLTFKATAPPVEWPKRKHGIPGFSNMIFSKKAPC